MECNSLAINFGNFYCNIFDEWARRGGGVLGRWEVGVGGVREACEGRERGLYWMLGEACVGCAWGVRGACVGAIIVDIARSALLSGYLGKSGHLPR